MNFPSDATSQMLIEKTEMNEGSPWVGEVRENNITDVKSR
jgi:hypothetical protein